MLPGQEVVQPIGKGDGVLKIGTLLPATGDLAFLGPPEFAGVDLATEEINAGRWRARQAARDDLRRLR